MKLNTAQIDAALMEAFQPFHQMQATPQVLEEVEAEFVRIIAHRHGMHVDPSKIQIKYSHGEARLNFPIELMHVIH